MLGLYAISESPIDALPDTLRATFVGIVTFTAIETDDFKIYACTEEYISRRSDTPSGQPFRGSLNRLPQFDRSIISDDFSGLSNGWGEAVVINAEGDYDQYLVNYAVDGREVLFRAGDPSTSYAEFFDVAKLIATTLTVEGGQMVVGLQDKSFVLAVPTQPNVYAGTGDLEGGADLAGKRKPLAFGQLKNVTPAPVIAAELVLQVHDGAVSSITAVYDKGYPLTFSANYATPALMRAGGIADGSYATCTAYGLIRAGAAYQQITCDVHGDASGSGYVETTGTIIRRIVTLTGCLDDPADIDTVSFANLELTQPAAIGYYLGPDSTETVAQTIDNLVKGISGFCGFTRLGLLQAGVFTAPSGTPIASYTDLDILDDPAIERLPSSYDPPPWRRRVAYERNWTQINDPVAGVIVLDAARAAWLGAPYKVTSTADATGDVVRADHLLAQDPPVKESYFASLTDAANEANRLLTLGTSNYKLLSIRLKAHPFTHDMCQTIRADFSRYATGNGLWRIAAISDIPENNTVELRVFG